MMAFSQNRNILRNTYIYIYNMYIIYMCVYIYTLYIYIEREREREYILHLTTMSVTHTHTYFTPHIQLYNKRYWSNTSKVDWMARYLARTGYVTNTCKSQHLKGDDHFEVLTVVQTIIWKTNLQIQGGCGINVAQVRDRMRALTNTTTKIRVPLSWGNLLARWATISF